MENRQKRTFIPGDEWVYFKLYTGYKTADSILANVLSIAIMELHARDMVQKWFFIRYADPEFHLRVRLLVTDKKHLSSVIEVFYRELEPYVSQDLIWKVQLDTYQREIERYGRSSIALAESIFHSDSDAIVQVLREVESPGKDEQRWLVALKMVDEMLSDFKLDIHRRSSLLDALSADFKTEMGFHLKGFKLQLDRKFRAHRAAVTHVLEQGQPAALPIGMQHILNQRSSQIRPFTDKLLQMEKENQLDIPMEQFLRSVIHMTINRMFRSKQRIYELVIYDMLRRYYISMIAKSKRIA